MDFQNLEASLYIPARHRDMPVQATGARQGRIEHIYAIGRAEHHDSLCACEAIHFHKQLIQGLIGFHIAAAAAGVALASRCVDLVNEDNTGSLRPRLLEQRAYTTCTYADKHLDKFGASRAKEWDSGFTGNRLGKQSLACARIAD